VASTGPDGKLAYHQQLGEMVERAAEHLLSAEIRLSIRQVTSA
jgi:hypothetical protein